MFAESNQPEVIPYLKNTLDDALNKKEGMIDKWKEKYLKPQTAEVENIIELIGYQPPDFLVSMADISSFLYASTGEKKYAEITRELIVSLESYRQYFPKRFRDRVEYREGIPVVNWFRSLPRFTACYERTKNSAVYSKMDIEKIKESVAASVNIIFMFPEWGAMNRAMLRAESLVAAALTFPDHPQAKKWKKMAEALANDSIEKWEIEDAQIYHPVWLRPYIGYLDLTGRTEVFKSPMMKFYFDYFVRLLAPNGTIPEFGDGRWADNLYEYYLVLARGAKEYQSGEMQWAANKIFDNICQAAVAGNPSKTVWDEPNLSVANLLVSRAEYADANLLPVEPTYQSGDVLEEVISKKIIFRSGWDKDATYLLLNYKDEGYYSLLQKDYLKHVLAVEEEKMHHGHSDENSICLLMKNGSVLLKDGNYREIAPSGEFGAFRADIFHNRIVVRNVKKYLTQPYFAVLRNSGAYNDQVRTTKIDFQDFKKIEYSRTRLEDQKLSYRWDRIITHHKQDDYFIVVDALKFFKSDYFTIANLFHTQEILQSGENWFLTKISQMAGRIPNAENYQLLIIFPQQKFIGTEKERRDVQEELALFQGTSQYYDFGQVESFVTILYPLKKGEDPLPVVKKFKLIRDDRFGIGIEVENGKELYGFKLNLDMDLLKEDVRPRYHYDSGKLTYGNAETDGDVFFLEIVEGKPYFSATCLVKFIYNHQILFDTPESQFFQVWGKSDLKGRAKWRVWDNY